jgi:uroporphyrinogen-III synthase
MYGGLRGRRILVTRPKTQGGRLHQAVATLGGEVLWIPAIETVAEPLDDEGRELLHRLDSFNWVAFTSENALSFFLDIVTAEGLELPRSLSVAAVGEATAKACQARNLKVQARPDVFTGAALGELLATEFRSACPGARRAARTLPTG